VHEREIGSLAHSSKTTELVESVTESARRLRRCVSMALNGRIRTNTCSGGGGGNGNDDDDDDDGWCFSLCMAAVVVFSMVLTLRSLWQKLFIPFQDSTESSPRYFYTGTNDHLSYWMLRGFTSEHDWRAEAQNQPIMKAMTVLLTLTSRPPLKASESMEQCQYR
jgi:hypothetical protein